MSGAADPEFASRPPRSADSERAILGAVLVDEAALRTVARLLSPNDFFFPAHHRIFAAMQSLSAAGQPVELITFCDAVRDDPEVCALGGPPTSPDCAMEFIEKHPLRIGPS
jgi:replicative DNA helicase